MLQHIVAHGGNTQPPLFRAGISSSMFLPSQYKYNDPIPGVCVMFLPVNKDKLNMSLQEIYASVVQQSG